MYLSILILFIALCDHIVRAPGALASVAAIRKMGCKDSNAQVVITDRVWGVGCDDLNLGRGEVRGLAIVGSELGVPKEGSHPKYAFSRRRRGLQ
ncbi:hypothetical protein BKA56DRAFT_589729 [Ilyonectria sp. MPI-CAGE-AT-0026]|nr:hypothetical protein BKA56DRAFT_589729 [Ilyonectria sp. MPI-CAGE-AT-0026]